MLATFEMSFSCPHCTSRLTKRNMQRAYVTVRDGATQQIIRQAKQVPVLINYTVGKQRLEKSPDDFDKAMLAAIDNEKLTDWFPADPMMGIGENWGADGERVCMLALLLYITFTPSAI